MKKLSKGKYILIILIFSFIIRIWGFNFGLPYLYNPDEACYTNKAINFFTGDFNPHWFGHPGSVLINILFLLYGIYFIIGLFLGNWSNITSFINLYKNNPTIFYILGRFTTVFFGTISVYILYKIVIKLFDHEYALISAVILAVAPLHVYHSKLIRTDITQTMLILFALYYFINYLELKRKKDIFIGSMFFGFSIATKWPSLLLIIPFLMTIFMGEKASIRNMGEKASTRNSRNKINLLLLYIMIAIILILLAFSLFIVINRNTILNPFIIRLFINKNFGNQGLNKLILIINSLILFNITFLSLLLICFLLATLNIQFFVTVSNIILNIIVDKIFFISLFIIFLSFFIMAPFVFIDFFEAAKWFIVEARDGHIGADGLGFIGNSLFYLRRTFNKDYGIGIEILSFIGIFYLLKDRKKLDDRHLIFFSFPFFYFFSIISLALHHSRWVIPIFPFLGILCTVAIMKLSTMFVNKSYRNLFLIFILMIILIAPVKNSILTNYKLTQKDTRTVSKEWIESNLPKNSVIAYEHYSPHLHIKPRKDFILFNYDWSRIVYKPLEHYINKNIDYIIITSRFKNSFYKEPERYKRQIKRYEILEARCDKVKTFKPEKFQDGPEITIYKLPKY